MTEATEIDIDDLLDATLDDLEDLPEFAPYPPGVHRVLVSLELKEVNDQNAVELKMKAVETVELSDTKFEPLAAGAETSVLFLLNNEFGRGNMKLCLKPIGEALGLTKTRDIIEQTKEVECLVLTSLRKDKNDKEKFYTNIKELKVS